MSDRTPRTPAASLDRRTFIKYGVGTGVAAGLLGGAHSALGAASWSRILGANDRINIAVIGTGGQGTWHLNSLVGRVEAENLAITRVCDVYRRRLNHSAKLMEKTGSSGSGATMEYREIIDDKNVNAILIATPDHWHTKMAIEAMEAGKDVYCEKPLSLTTDQAIQCRDAVKRTNRILQVGPQGTSEDRWWKARAAIGAGRIGKVVWSQGSYCRNSREGQFNWTIDPDASPKDKSAEGYVDWDRWLGHEWNLAEKIPWNPDHFFRFRKYFAYNGGLATDLLYHRLAPLLLSITGPNGEYPKRVVASGGRYIEKDERDIPDTFFMMVDYPSDHTIVLTSVMTNDDDVEDAIRGQYGTIKSGSGGEVGAGSAGTLRIVEQETWAPEFRKANADLGKFTTSKDDKGKDKLDPPAGRGGVEIALGATRDHVGNFLDSVRGKAKPNCNIDLGCSTMVAIKMGVEAYRRGKTMKWDPKTEKMLEA